MAGFLLCTFGGWRWLAHSDFDYPDRPPASRTRRLPRPAEPIPQPTSVSSQPAVLIDVTDLTKGLAWELELLHGLGRLDDCIFLALHGFEASAQAMLTHQLGRTVRLLTFDRAGRLIAPREFRNALAAIIFRTTGRPADLITVPDPPGGPGDQ